MLAAEDQFIAGACPRCDSPLTFPGTCLQCVWASDLTAWAVGLGSGVGA